MAQRKSICNKFYMDANGVRSNSATVETTIIGFDLLDKTGAKDKDDKHIVEETLTYPLESFAACSVQAQAMGLMQKIGDAYAGKGDEASEIIATMAERLQAGDWVVVGKGGVGPLPSMLLEAIVRVVVAAGGEDTPELRIGVRASIEEDADKQAALADPAIRAAYETIRAERAQEKAAKAVEKANEADGQDSFASAFING